MDISVSDAPVGRLLDGRYRVEAMLARGGMATVYRAVDTRLDRRVALKVMHAELAADDDFVSRFIGEARSAARLSDPHVVAVFDQGEDSGAVYLAMEYVEGRTLREVVRERERLRSDLALEVMESVLAALAAAHQAGIVHRDVKPENVLVGNDGRVKVADFGLARAMSSGPNTSRGLLLGTVNYISPEQALGESATPRSDVYSAGIMLFELLTGSAPHVGPTDFVVVRSHIDHDVPPPSSVVPVPAVVDEVVRVATSRDPDGRFSDATAFLAAIRRARTAISGAARSPERGTSVGAEPDQVAGEEALRSGEISVAEPREAAGVTLGEALGVPTTADDKPSTPAPSSLPPPPPPAHVTPAAAPALVASAAPAGGTRVIDTGGPSAVSSRRHADRRDRVEARRSGSHAQGNRRSLRGPIFFAVILVVTVGIAVAAWWFGAGRWTSAPSLLNLSPEAAQARAADDGLTAVADGEAFSETVEPGLIVSTDPRPGEQVLRDGEIAFTVSKGPERYEVPELTGKPGDAATSMLEELHLSPELTEAFHDTVPAGTVVSQEVAAGEQVRRDTVVPFVVSKGPAPVEIVDYTGQSGADAEAALTEAGLVVHREDQTSNTVAPGFVISQDPASGTGARGQQVTLVVSAGPEQVQVPQVGHLSLGEAQAMLQGRGFVVNVVPIISNGGQPGPDSRIVRQEPGGGTLPYGGTVTLFVF